MCTCKSNTLESKYDSYWEDMVITKTTPKDYINFHQGKYKNITKEIWLTYYFPKLKNSNYYQDSKNLWEHFYDKYSNEKDFNYFLFTPLLLTDTLLNKETFFEYFCMMVLFSKINNTENSENKIKEIKTIKRLHLRLILEIYINIVSLDGIVYSNAFADDSLLEDIKQKYSSRFQSILLSQILQPYEEVINIKDFVENNLAKLHHKAIREELHKIYLDNYTGK